MPLTSAPTSKFVLNITYKEIEDLWKYVGITHINISIVKKIIFKIGRFGIFANNNSPYKLSKHLFYIPKLIPLLPGLLPCNCFNMSSTPLGPFILGPGISRVGGSIGAECVGLC